MRLRLSAKPSTAERRQTLCAVQTLSGFPQRSFPAHKRAILRTSHTKLPFFDKQSRARMRWARLKFRLCRGTQCTLMPAVLPPSAPPYTIRLCLGQGSGVRPGCAGFAAAKPQVQITLCQNEFSVHQNVQRGQQLLLGRRSVFQEFFKGIACIAGNLVTIGLQQLCQFSKRLRLAERLATGKVTPRTSGFFFTRQNRSCTVISVPVPNAQLSGLWQPSHRRGQPCAKIAVRRPGPSTMESSMMPAILIVCCIKTKALLNAACRASHGRALRHAWRR